MPDELQLSLGYLENHSDSYPNLASAFFNSLVLIVPESSRSAFSNSSLHCYIVNGGHGELEDATGWHAIYHAPSHIVIVPQTADDFGKHSLGLHDRGETNTPRGIQLLYFCLDPDVRALSVQEIGTNQSPCSRISLSANQWLHVQTLHSVTQWVRSQDEEYLNERLFHGLLTSEVPVHIGEGQAYLRQSRRDEDIRSSLGSIKPDLSVSAARKAFHILVGGVR